MIPQDVKKNVRAVLLSKDGGMPMCRFLQDYSKLLLESLNFRKLGFSSLKGFFEAMPEVVRLDASQGESSIRVFGVAEPDSYLSVSARKAQGKLPKNYHKNLKGTTTAADQSGKKPTSTSAKKDRSPGDSGVETSNMGELTPDHNGLYSVFIPKDKCEHTKKQEIGLLFSQAGVVENIYVSDRHIFLRYKTEKEVRECMDLFSEEYGMRIARNTLKGNDSDSNPVRKSRSDNSRGKPNKGLGRKSRGCATDVEDTDDQQTDVEAAGHNRFKPKRSGGGRSEQQLAPPKMVNGHKNMTNGGDSKEFQLFVGNIESEEAFLELIEPFQPVQLRLLCNGLKKFGFIKVKSYSKAERIIVNLSGTKHPGGRMVVDFDKGEQSTKNEQETSQPSKSHKPKVSEKMPPLEVDYSCMPQLVPEKNSSPNSELNDLDYPVFVGNFPSASLESSIRQVFEDFKVLDVCILNNNHEQGCTKAYVYLTSVYELARAVKTLNGKSVEGSHLHIKVAVPHENKIVKRLVAGILKKKNPVSSKSS